MHLPTKASYIAAKSVLTATDRAYRMGRPVMTDKKWDDLFRAVSAVEALHPDWKTADTIGDDSRKGRKMHPYAGTWDEMEKGYDLPSALHWYTHSAPAASTLQPKVDGVALCITYKNGQLAVASLRGSGLCGDIVTQHVLHAAGIPLTLAAPVNCELRGELYMTRADLARLNQTAAKAYNTPRNAVAACVALKSPEKALAFPLRFIAYKTTPLKKRETIDPGTLRQSGVQFMPETTIPASTTADAFSAALQDMEARLRRQDIPVDGIVIRRASTVYAYKFYDAEATVTITRIERGGHNAPVAVFAPVKMDGMTIARVTLHNDDWAARHGIAPGTTIRLIKRGGTSPVIAL